LPRGVLLICQVGRLVRDAQENRARFIWMLVSPTSRSSLSLEHT
jgi:hypothetical protein